MSARLPRRNPVERADYVSGPKISLYLGRFIHEKMGVNPSSVVEAIRVMLKEMGAYEGMTVFPAQGVYAHKNGRTVKEPTMFIVLLCPEDLSYAQAIERAGILALNLAALYQQETVLAEVTAGDGTQRIVLSGTCDGDLKCESIRDRYKRFLEVPSRKVTLEEFYESLRST
jgi:hypothetical protein